MKNLVYNGWRYYHSEIKQSPFGGRSIERNPQKHNLNTGEIVYIKDWGEALDPIIDDMGDDEFNNTNWDLDYLNPFIDYR